MNLAAKPEPFQHITVLLNEAVDALNIQENGIYVDGTFGRGGHSRLILSKLGEKGRLVVFDKDPQAIAVAQDLAAQDARVSVVNARFWGNQFKPKRRTISSQREALRKCLKGSHG